MTGRSLQRTTLALVFGAAIALAGADTWIQNPTAAGTSEEQRLDAESFEYVWKTVRDKHIDPSFGGVDWQAAHLEYQEKVTAARSRSEIRRLIMEMLHSLKVTHFAIIPGELYDTVAGAERQGSARGSSGIESRVVDGMTLVTRVEAGSPAWESGIRPGWEVLRVGDRELRPLIASVAAEYEVPRRSLVESAVAYSLLQGKPGESLVAAFRNSENETVEKTIILGEPSGRRFQAAHIPPVYIRISADRLPGDIGRIAFNHFLDPSTVMPVFNEAMKSFMDTKGIVVDLRGNPGGQAEMISGMAGWFIAEKGRHLGVIQLRDLQLKLVVRPRPQTYDGPVAILVDELSTCASEIMALGLREAGRARVFGARTGGATLGSAIERLPNGDGFQYPFADFHSAAGQRLEGIGVIPDEEIRPTRDSLLEGRDVELEAAVNWIESRRKSGSTTATNKDR